MLNRIDLRGRRDADLARELPRADVDVAHAVEDIRAVVEGVRDRGAVAVIEATSRFDGVDLTDLRVPAAALSAAVEQLDPDVRAAIEESIRRHRELCTAQLRADVVVGIVDGGTVTERWVPVHRVGLYVP
ncbi:MAG: histidinol dehydrogenase, partial [Frankiales bacterium]|nr:histidinol dehydrogenase [Frankiales bacterium]